MKQPNNVYDVPIENIPKDFDWQYYIDINEDLKDIVQNKRTAMLHYCLYGFKENRFYKPQHITTPSSFTENNFLTKWKSIYDINDTKIIFNKSDKPKVSIVIPSYNKPYYTLACLESLSTISMIKDCEIIVVNDCSTDNTKQLLEKYVEGIILVNNETNLGFVETCNKGANHAHSPYLMFLNNDTILFKDTVVSLYNSIQKDNVGAVGGMIITPDNLLQEAGSMLMGDGSCFGYGRGDDYNKPEYNYVREVDYCSGALLMTKKHLWSQIGGFDAVYSPGYYEEVDYCMQLKQLGYKILYQPLSKIYHFEFGTFGDKAVSIQMHNRDIFLERWQPFIDKYSLIQENIHKRRSRNNNKRLLYIDDILPDPKKGQGYPRSHDILSYIVSLGFQVTLYTSLFEDNTDKNLILHFQQLGVEIIRNDTNFDQFISCRKNLYDIAFVSRPHNAEKYIKKIRANNDAKIIYDAEAIYANREILQAEIVDGAELSEEVKNNHRLKEINITKHADAICLVSKYEQDLFSQNKVTNTKILGHCHPIKFEGKSFNERKDLLFVGAIVNEHKYNPNYDSIIYFVNNIWPRTLDQLGCNLLLVGYNNSPTIKALNNRNNIKVIGGVETLDSYYKNCKLFIGPTRFAAGIPHKVTNAISYGLPSVITPLLAKQLEWSNGKECLIGKDDQDFADKIATLYTDKNVWTDIRNNMKQYTENTFSEKAFKSCLNEILL